MDIFIELAEEISKDLIDIVRNHIDRADCKLEQKISDTIYYHLTSGKES
jgi:hypothetical protein